jgi:predicted tellurium resistance membrane protein TerC
VTCGDLIEKSLSLDNVFVFAVIFSAFAIPARSGMLISP